jgi:predicted PurR-regulated permease PerM
LTEKIKQLIIIIDVPSMATNFFTGAGNFFFIFFSTIFMLFFFLKEENLFHRLIAIFIPDEQEPKLENTFTNVRNMLFRYFFGILIQVSCIALYVTILLYFFGLENAFLQVESENANALAIYHSLGFSLHHYLNYSILEN